MISGANLTVARIGGQIKCFERKFGSDQLTGKLDATIQKFRKWKHMMLCGQM
jgi:hypothetical protein